MNRLRTLLFGMLPMIVGTAVAGANGGGDYWIADSHACPQSRLTGGPRCSLRFAYVPANGSSRPVSKQILLSSLCPGRPLLIAVHGSFVDERYFLKQNRLVTRWVRHALPNNPPTIIFYRWPSEEGPIVLPQINAAVLGRMAGFNGLYLARLIADLPAGIPVTVMGHSHGSRIAAAALHFLGGGRVQGYVLPANCRRQHRLRAVLMAAAIDHHWLNPGQRYGRALCSAEKLLILTNHRDIVLHFYPYRKLFSGRALGATGLLRSDRYRLGARNSRVLELDVTRQIGRGHLLPRYTEHPEIAAAIAPLLSFAPSGTSQQFGRPALGRRKTLRPADQQQRQQSGRPLSDRKRRRADQPQSVGNGAFPLLVPPAK